MKDGTSVCGSPVDLLTYMWGRAPTLTGRIILRCEGEWCGSDHDEGAVGSPFLLNVSSWKEEEAYQEVFTILKVLESANAWWSSPDHAPGAHSLRSACHRAIERLREVREIAALDRDYDRMVATRKGIAAIKAIMEN